MDLRFNSLHIRADADEKKSLLEDPTLPVPWFASGPGELADGFDLKPEDWRLDRYNNYPIVLFGHDHAGFFNLPIGTGVARVEDEGLFIDVTYDVEDEFARRVRAKALKGMMGGSVGWSVDEDEKNVLHEFSMVPVGMDPRALPDIQTKGLRMMQQAIDNYLSDDPIDTDLIVSVPEPEPEPEPEPAPEPAASTRTDAVADIATVVATAMREAMSPLYLMVEELSRKMEGAPEPKPEPELDEMAFVAQLLGE